VTVDSLFPNKNLREAVNAYKRSMGMEVKDTPSSAATTDISVSNAGQRADGSENANNDSPNGMLALAQFNNMETAQINPLQHGSAIAAIIEWRPCRLTFVFSSPCTSYRRF